MGLVRYFNRKYCRNRKRLNLEGYLSWAEHWALLTAAEKALRSNRVKRPRPNLPWPRSASDGTPLGVDLSKKMLDVKRLALSQVRAPRGVDPEDFVSEVYLAIARKNKLPKSCFDPRRASFSHYVVVVAKSVKANLALAQSKWDAIVEPSLTGDVPDMAGPEPDETEIEEDLFEDSEETFLDDPDDNDDWAEFELNSSTPNNSSN